MLDQKNRKIPLSIIAVAFLGILGASDMAQATLLVEDQFLVGTGDYTSGPPLVAPGVGQTSSGSIGFSGAWSGANSGYFSVLSSNLSFTGLPNTGGSLLIGATNNGDYSRSDSRSMTVSASQSSLYFSMLMRTDAATLANGATSMVGFLSGALRETAVSSATGATWMTSNGGNLAGFAWGISGGAFSVEYQSNAGGAGAVNLVNTGFTPTAGVTYLLIGRLDINAAGNDTLSIWATTSLPASQAALGAPIWSISTADILADSSNLNTLALWAGVTSSATPVTNSTTVDAIRIGTTFNDVVAVPEPSTTTASLLGVIGMGLWIGVRKKLRTQSAHKV